MCHQSKQSDSTIMNKNIQHNKSELLLCCQQCCGSCVSLLSSILTIINLFVYFPLILCTFALVWIVLPPKKAVIKYHPNCRKRLKVLSMLLCIGDFFVIFVSLLLFFWIIKYYTKTAIDLYGSDSQPFFPYDVSFPCV